MKESSKESVKESISEEGNKIVDCESNKINKLYIQLQEKSTELNSLLTRLKQIIE